MIIPSVGKQKIQYSDHTSVNFESLDFYLNLAQKIIAKLAPTFFNGLSKEMLKNEDAIAFVANAIMMGDWRWKKGDEKDSKKYKTLYSYRNQCAIWAIKTYVTKKYKIAHSTKKSYSMSGVSSKDFDDLSITDVIADTSQKEPIEILIAKENTEICEGLIHQILESNILSEKQKDHIKMYYFEHQTLEKIGEKYGVTREAIRQSIKSSVNKIRNLS
jgi:RNA polymerase sigma factor (sigma-70 family)